MRRRALLVAMPALAGCTKYGDETAPPAPSSAPPSGGGEPLLKTADVPVGGGTVLADQKVVVTQPTQGEFKAFSAVCTHQGCAVKDVTDGTINCPCHASKFRIADASVAAGPAPGPLAVQPITVQGDEIFLA